MSDCTGFPATLRKGETTMLRRKAAAAVLFNWMVCGGTAFSQQMTAPAKDEGLNAASSLVGKALFLRGFYLSNELTFDADGRVQGTPKVGDWTLAAVNVLKVERRGAGEIELDGVRVAIRYNTDSHEFQRHALNDDKMRLLVKDTGKAKQLEMAFAAMFSVGIDPGLQRAMPDYWRHYFDPTLVWPQDALSGQTSSYFLRRSSEISHFLGLTLELFGHEKKPSS
jgi:hypothetical protein